jgi:excinuclease ABC subunit A
LQVLVFLSRYRGYARCPDCEGSRLRSESLNVQVNGKTIAQAARMNIAQAHDFFGNLNFTPEEEGIAGKILVEIEQRLRFLKDVGLEYLTLDRLAATLSGGEAQRIQLATCLGSRLVGACYVLDEPSIGLHARDTARLLAILAELRDIGNTILVVEHDPDVMKAADHIIDLGPGAGEHGGQIVFEGDYKALVSKANQSLTGKYLRGELKVARPRKRRVPKAKNMLRVIGATIHNLKGLDVEIPLGMLTVVTGVSGSGKSSLVHDVIYRSLQAQQQAQSRAEATPDSDLSTGDAPRMTCTRLEGAQGIKDVVMIDQTPIGRTPRSNPHHVHQSVRYRARSLRGDEGSGAARLHGGALLLQRTWRAL